MILKLPEYLKQYSEQFLKDVVVKNVIFGFHEKELKVFTSGNPQRVLDDSFNAERLMATGILIKLSETKKIGAYTSRFFISSIKKNTKRH
jgi:hypothetical protein